jgi:hypothetical protein
MTYTGTLIKDLHSSVERAEQRVTPEDERPEEFEAPDMDAILRRAESSLTAFLVRAMDSLADRMIPEPNCHYCPADAICERCSWNIAYCVRGWHRLQDLYIDRVEVSEDRNERALRTGLDLWLQSQAGC